MPPYAHSRPALRGWRAAGLAAIIGAVLALLAGCGYRSAAPGYRTADGLTQPGRLAVPLVAALPVVFENPLAVEARLARKGFGPVEAAPGFYGVAPSAAVSRTMMQSRVP